MTDHPSPSDTFDHPPVVHHSKGSKMSDILIFVAIFAVWFALQAWILPRFGVST